MENDAYIKNFFIRNSPISFFKKILNQYVMHYLCQFKKINNNTREKQSLCKTFFLKLP